jgi:curved DNA-binding protein CbpA
MTPQTELEVQGNFLMHPFAELIAEIAAARLNGSLRVSEKEKKCIVYFRSGEVVFAVSNARSARLFDILLRRNRLKKEDLGQIPNFANDHELSAYLQDKGYLTKRDVERLFTEQIEGIIIDLLTWPSGNWTFSSLARIRDGLSFQVDTRRMLVDYARCMPEPQLLARFRSMDETFERSELPETAFELTADESYVLWCTNAGELSASNIAAVSSYNEAKALHLIYILWLAGLLERQNWQPAFSPEAVHAMKRAKLELRREAKLPGVPDTVPEVTAETAGSDAGTKQPAIPEMTLSVDAYLDRVENAETYYDILGVDTRANIAEIKRAYFAMARMFHPDRFHAEGGDILRRMQSAFTELAQAHETLKNTETREVYDYRMRKEIAAREKNRAQGVSGNARLQIDQAGESFQAGFNLLMDGKYEEALPMLARAAHYDPKNAKYHAYYGKALAEDQKQRHKAESEMQTALKLDPDNPTFRMMLAEFFVKNNLLKRAEGEVTRLLAKFPSNREAQNLLASLKTKA